MSNLSPPPEFPDGTEPVSAELIDAFRAEFRAEVPDLEVLRQRQWARVQAAMACDRGQGKPARGIRGAHVPRWVLRVGTTITVVSAMVVLASFGVRHPSMFRYLSHHPRFDRGPQYVTHTGQRATITFSDGSRAILAPQTTLTLDHNFGTTSRTVVLDGEAYFDVTAAKRTPFLVRTKGTIIRVLGTTFDVRRYRADPNTHIAVITGRVAISSSHRDSSATVTSGMIATVTDSSVTSVPNDDVTHYAAWTTGYLFFQRAPLQDVLAALTRWYGYQFRVVDSTVSQQRLTIGLSATSAQDALATLKLTLDVDFAFDGNVVTVQARHQIISPRNRDRQGLSAPPPLKGVGR